MREVVELRWYGSNHWSPAMRHWAIGFVAVLDEDAEGPWFKVYVGLGMGADQASDVELVAEQGVPLLDELMARHLLGARAEGRRYVW